MKIVLMMTMILTTSTARADLLLDIMLGNYDVPEQTTAESDYEHEYGNSSGEPEHYSWDNLYPCHYCGIEVIVDPYAESSSDY